MSESTVTKTSHITLPPEWAEQYAVMLTWPHKNTDWSDIIEEVDELYFVISKEILRHQNLIVSCADLDKLDQIAASLSTSLKSGHSLTTHHIPADDTWARDHGPITVYKDNTAQLVDFRFNAWGNKFPSAQDNLINRRLYEQNAFPGYEYQYSDIILEGGSIESNGAGVLLTTSECLLAPTRNPTYDKQSLTDALKNILGIKEILWLDHGYLAGDDTDSHIDTLARFCAEDLICYVRCDDPDDEHYEALNKMEAQLKTFKQLNGKPYRLEALPMTDMIMEDGERLPATYANFLIINNAILAPVYGVKQDKQALAILRRCFPDREVVPIDCYSLIKQHGSLHCITMQIPNATPNTRLATCDKLSGRQ